MSNFFFLKTFWWCRYRSRNAPYTQNPSNSFFQDGVESIFIDENWCRLSDLVFDRVLFLHGAFCGQQLRFKLCGAEWKNNFWFFILFFLNCFQEEIQYRYFTSNLSTYFSRAQIFEKFIGEWGLLRQCGTTGAQRTGTVLLNLGLRKIRSKLLTLSVLHIRVLLSMLHW